MNDCVPFKSADKRPHLPWMTVKREYLIRKNQRVYNCMRTYHTENDWTEYEVLQKQVSKMLKSQHKSYIIMNIMSSIIIKSILIIWAYTSRRKEES